MACQDKRSLIGHSMKLTALLRPSLTDWPLGRHLLLLLLGYKENDTSRAELQVNRFDLKDLFSFTMKHWNLDFVWIVQLVVPHFDLSNLFAFRLSDCVPRLAAAPRYGGAGRRPTWNYSCPTEKCLSPTRKILRVFFIGLVLTDNPEVYSVLYWREFFEIPHWCALRISHKRAEQKSLQL